MVALIDTGRAVNAFQLGPVADIDPGGTDVHALETVDAVSQAQDIPVLDLAEFLASVFPFPPLVVIGHQDGFFVQQYPLHSAIGTGDEPYQFPEPGKDEIEDTGEDKERDHGPHMGQGAVPYMGDQGVTPDQVGQKNIGDQKGDQKENGPFQYPFANLLPGPWGAVQTDLCPPIPI